MNEATQMELAGNQEENRPPVDSLVISVRQPWAWLIINAGKDIENRDWFTKVRGRVLIHAAKGVTKTEWQGAWGWVHQIAPEAWEMGCREIKAGTGRSQNDPNKYALQCVLPGLKPHFGWFENEHLAMNRAQELLVYWMEGADL